MESLPKTYLGFDWSTQKLKAVIIDENLKILQEAEVHYDSDLAEFRTNGGVLKREKGEILAPPLMWVKALDMILDRLTLEGADFYQVAAISGAAQQHGSVWWAKGSQKVLDTLDNTRFLYEQVAMAFSLLECPVWMDSSTKKWCNKIEESVGGPRALASITGSRAYERFTGSQIAKIFETKKMVYDNTERISLISSFGCSLLAGKIVDIDYSDASGMNLMDIHQKSWNSECLKVCGDDSLEGKLGTPAKPHDCVGTMSPYFVERFGFNEKCKVIPFTGDNPSTLAGMRLSHGWITVSLGTSDTLIIWLEEPHTVLDGHVMCNPVDEAAYFALLCFSNGSLAREGVRDRLAEKSWDTFNNMLNSTPRGNFGNIGINFDIPEIVPKGTGSGRWFWGKNGAVLNKLPPESEVRALVEGQFIARRAHAEDIGFVFDKDTKILATGGASQNNILLQVMADVFNAPVYTQDCANSALLGAAYRAKHGLLYAEAESDKPCFMEATESAPSPTLVCSPYGDAAQIYEPMIQRYREYIADIITQNCS